MRKTNERASTSEEIAPKQYATLQGVGRALEIIEAVAQRPMRASDIAEQLGLKWTTAYRSVAYLLENRYLRKDEATSIYSIGPRIFYLGQAYLMDHPLREAGTQLLKALAFETGASVQLNEREGLKAAVLMAVDPRLEMIPKTTPEFHFPLHAGSKGHALLAYSDPSVYEELVAEPLLALTEQTITDPRVLLERLAEIRASGFAVTRKDVQIDTGSVAAPVFAGGGRLAGAICAIVNADEISDDVRTDALVGAVVRTAREISVRVGWRHGDRPVALAAWTEYEGTP